MNTVQFNWENYSSTVIPDAAPQWQTDEMKQAFYSGAFTMLTMMIGISTDPSISDGAKEAIMESLDTELVSYMHDRLLEHQNAEA
jgi:hypothetical protein